MKTTTKLLLIAISIASVSCAKDFGPDEKQVADVKEETAAAPVLRFGSPEELAATISELKERENFDLKSLPRTRAQVSAENFVSLRQHLLEQGLREFTDDELAEISRDSLIYEPEDSLIVDPYMTAVLNENREVQVGDNMCRFVDEGMLVYEATDKELAFSPELMDTRIDTDDLAHGESIDVVDTKGAQAKLIKIDYTRATPIDPEDGRVNNGSNNGSSSDNGSVSYNYDGSITLTNNVKIPANMINRAFYEKGNGESSWLGKTVSGIFGINVTITNNYDKKNRMKVRMYEQDYIIYRAIGMTVRMQTRKFGIWWRKKAQEFRYGWSAIECEYKFPKPAFVDPPKMPNGQFQYAKYPTGMTKKFPFADAKVVLFHVPLTKYDITTGDVNNAFYTGMKVLASNIRTWFEDPANKDLKNNPRGLFTTREEDKSLLVIFPQGEEVDYNTGREVVRWDKQWFSGNFQIGFSSNLAGGGFHYKNVSFSPSKDVSIIRGRIYGAVKYNNQWRACVIESK